MPVALDPRHVALLDLQLLLLGEWGWRPTLLRLWVRDHAGSLHVRVGEWGGGEGAVMRRGAMQVVRGRRRVVAKEALEVVGLLADCTRGRRLDGDGVGGCNGVA